MKQKLLLAFLFALCLTSLAKADPTPSLEALPLTGHVEEALALGGGGQTGPTGPTFFYVVTAVDSAGFESINSNESKAVFTQGTHNAVGTWVAPVIPPLGKGIAGYNIYRGTVTGGPYTKINTALVTVLTYTDTFVPPNAPTGSSWTVN